MDMNHLALEIHEWANEVHPERTDASMFFKLYGEIAELIESGDDCADEIADVLIMLLDYAKRKGVNPSAAVQNKMNVNRLRQWRINQLGVMSHVHEEPLR